MDRKASFFDIVHCPATWMGSDSGTRATRAGLLGVGTAALLYAAATELEGCSFAAWAAPGLLLVSVRRMRPAIAFASGVVFAFLIGLGSTGWSPSSVVPYFGLSAVVTRVLSAVGLAVHAGLPYGLLALAYARWSVGMPSFARSSLAAWLWVGCELLRTAPSAPASLGLLGHTQLPYHVLTEIADFGGVYAASFVIALVSVATAELLADAATLPLTRGAVLRRVAIPALALLAAIAYGVSSRQVGGPVDGARRPARLVIVRNSDWGKLCNPGLTRRNPQASNPYRLAPRDRKGAGVGWL